MNALAIAVRRLAPLLGLSLSILAIPTCPAWGQTADRGVGEAAAFRPAPDDNLRDESVAALEKMSPEERFLKKKRDELRDTEDVVQRLRNEVKLTFREDAFSQGLRVQQAEATHKNAQLAVEIAKLAVTDYEGTFEQERGILLGEIALADQEIARAKEKVDETGRLIDQLALKKATLRSEEKRLELKVLTGYTKEKRLNELRAEVEKAQSEERAKRFNWDLEKLKARGKDRQAEAFQDRSFEAHVLILLDEAIGNEDRAVGLLKDAEKLAGQENAHPAEVETLANQLKEKRAEAKRLMNEAQRKLFEAVELGSDVRKKRMDLMDAEERLRSLRTRYEILQKLFNAKAKPAPKPADADGSKSDR